MPDLYLAIHNFIASGQLDDLVTVAVRTAIAEQAKATPSRGEIAAMVLAGMEANSSLELTPGQRAEWAVRGADALLVELAKPVEAQR